MVSFSTCLLTNAISFHTYRNMKLLEGPNMDYYFCSFVNMECETLRMHKHGFTAFTFVIPGYSKYGTISDMTKPYSRVKVVT